MTPHDLYVPWCALDNVLNDNYHITQFLMNVYDFDYCNACENFAFVYD